MIGRSLGPYAIREQLGAGGMGEVYLAEDTRLDRQVAIKVLPQGLSDDADRRERFEREAKVIAGLGHPNICSLFDVGSEDGIDFLVMELLDGVTLADRLEEGPLPLDEVLEFGAQIAEGLDAAHRAGVIHRDLKPGNVMLTANGAKILDFGLAKPTSVQQAVEDVTVAATRMQPVTAEGTIVGTLHYMSPEQLEAKPTDARSDIFALGALLHEMVTGARPFDGDSQASLIGSILKDEPPRVSELRELSPRQLDHVIRRCLEKKPERRWQSARDVGGELQWIRTEGVHADEPAAGVAEPATAPRTPWVVAAAAAFVAIAAIAWALAGDRSGVAPGPVTFNIEISDDFELSPAMAFRPDGGQLAYILTRRDGESQIWLRDVDVLQHRPVPGTENASDMFYSPTGESLGFFADGELNRIDLASGRIQRLASVSNGGGGSWGVNGDIIYSDRGVIWRIPETGGQPEQVSELNPERLEDSHDWPHFMPDGDHYLVQADDPDDAFSGIQLHSLSSRDVVQLHDRPSNAQYAGGPGLLLYNASAGQGPSVTPFSLEQPTITQPGAAVTAEMFAFQVPHREAIVISDRGDLALQPRARNATRGLVIYAPDGEVLERIDDVGSGSVSMSADGKRMVIDRRSGGERFLALIAPGESPARLTPSERIGNQFHLSGDGSTLVYEILGAEPRFEGRDMDNGSRLEIDLAPQGWRFVGLSKDGSSMVLRSSSSPPTIAIYPLDGSEAPRVLGQLEETMGVVAVAMSPDGSWVAFADFTATGAPPRIWMLSTENPDRSFQLSTNGGRAPFWSPNERTVYFVDPRNVLYAVDIDAATGNPSLPRRMFPITGRGWTGNSPCRALTDGRIACIDYGEIPQLIEVRLHWTSSLPPFR